MADSRILHRNMSGSARVSSLSHLEFRVWVEYVLWADDLGVMRASASVLKAHNTRLELEPLRRLEATMGQIESAHLVSVFVHQGQRFWWQHDWQDWQQIKYPRTSTNPLPPFPERAKASKKTEKLFRELEERLGKDSGNISEIIHSLAGAGARETLTLTPTLEPTQELTPTQPIAFANPHGRPTNLINGSEQRQHGQHAWCSWPSRDGLCVPAFLHREFIGKLGRGSAEMDLRGWYPSVVEGISGVAVGEDAIKFWRNQFASWVGVATSAPTQGKGRATVDAFRIAGERLAGGES